jgi:hypothetical protein
MLLDFGGALADPRVGGLEGINRLSNAARTPASYFLTSILPERDVADYVAKGGSMRIRSTMAGLVGLDSTDPEGGAMDVSTFMERIAKISVMNRLQEQTIIELQNLARNAVIAGGNTRDIAVNAVLNFVAKLLLQPHYDRREWLRGQALFTGGIDWQFDGNDLQVDYSIPTANVFTSRTGNDAYDGSTSKFWTDWKAARLILGDAFRGAMLTRSTADAIIENPVNKVTVIADADRTITLVKYVGDDSGLRPPSPDQRERATFVVYDKEGEVWDLDNPGATKKVRLIPPGVLGFFGSNDRSSDFIVGEGATTDPENDRALGYSHIGPTVENNGQTGIWIKAGVPTDMEQHFEGKARGRFLPVIENPDKIVLASTTIGA